MLRFIVAVLALLCGTVAGHLIGDPASAQDWVPFQAPAASPTAPASPSCDAATIAHRLARTTRVTTSAPQAVGHGNPIEVAWQLPVAPAGKARAFLIAAMPDTVRFEGRFAARDDGDAERGSGPGFVALPARSRAPYGLDFGAGRARVVIPLDSDAPRSGSIAVKPYAAGHLDMTWAIAVVLPDCVRRGVHATAAQTVTRLGPFAVAAGTPRVVVQDFIEPSLSQELATGEGSQRLVEVELSPDGRYRLDIFQRRYRVFDRASGAKLVERSGVKPRFSPEGRFIVASIGDADLTYPTNFEVIDLVAGRVVVHAGGPLVGWSNGDALLLDGSRAYQTLTLINTLIDPVAENVTGGMAAWPTFSPGCGTCDAWTGSNVRFDWDRLSVLRGNAGNDRRAMSIVTLADGRNVETTLFGDDEALPLHARLGKIFGQRNVTLATGWTGNTPLKLTHVGRSFNGYADEEESLTPEEKRRPGQLDFLQSRRMAIADGRVVRAQDLMPQTTATRADATRRVRSSGGAPQLAAGYIADELAKVGLKLASATEIKEEPIERPANWEEPIVRPWPAGLKAEVTAAVPTTEAWFKPDADPRVVVGAWRIGDGVPGSESRILLLQHGEPAATINGAHQIQFDLVMPAAGVEARRLHTIEAIGGLFTQYAGRSHTLARVFALPSGRVVIAVPVSGKAVLLDPARPAAAMVLKITEPTLLCGFEEAAGGRHIVQSNCDGQLFVLDPARGEAPIVNGRVVDGELVLYTADGYYSATFEGAHFVHVSFPGLAGVHSFEQFAAVLDRPDVLRSLLRGEPVAVGAPALAPPPLVSLSAIGELAAVRVKASAVSGLAALEIYEDGGLVARHDVTGLAAERDIKFSPRVHIRTLTVVARDRLGFRSHPVSIARPAGRPGANTVLHVVAIGIDTYDNLVPLTGARKDAESLVAALRSQSPYYGAVRTTVRLDREATAEVVQADIRSAVEAAGPDDSILVFFAAHGGTGEDGRYYLTTAATDPDRLAATAIDWQSLSKMLGRARGRVLAVLDACHSGQTAVVTPNNEGAVASLATAASAPMIVLAASKGRQESEEVANGSGGIFTQTLARLLTTERRGADANGDGLLSVSELYISLKSAVERQTAGRQSPWLVRRNFAGDPPLF